MQAPLSVPAGAGEFSLATVLQVECRRGQILLAPCSPLNSSPEWLPLVDLYAEDCPLPPTPEEVATLLTELLRLGPQQIDVEEFEVQAAILRAAARQYFS